MKKSANGFTVIELLVVIVVISILASLTVVAFHGMQSRAKNASISAALDTYINALELYYIKNGKYPTPDDVPEYAPGMGWLSLCLGLTSDYPQTAKFSEGMCTRGDVLNTPYQGEVKVSAKLQQELGKHISKNPSVSALTDDKVSYLLRGIIYTPWYADGQHVQLSYQLNDKNSQCPKGWGNSGYLADGVRCAYDLHGKEW